MGCGPPVKKRNHEVTIMAITKILHINPPDKGKASAHLANAIDYILNPKKTENGLWTGSLNCDKDHALAAMLGTKDFFRKTDLRQGYHIVISFSPGEADEETAFDIVERFAKQYLGADYETVYAVHNDQGHMHGHIVFNSVNCITGRKYRYENGDWKKEIQPITNMLCEEWGLEIVNLNEKGLKMYDSYGDWMENKQKIPPVDMDQMRKDIDDAVASCSGMEEVMEYLELEKGYKIRLGKKVMSLCPPDRERGIRTYRLGYAYTPEALIKRLNGEEYQLPAYEKNEEDISGEPVRIARAGFRMKGTRGIYNRNQYYQYRDDVRELQQRQKNIRYLSKHNIRSVRDLQERKDSLSAAITDVGKERETIFRERNKHKEAIHLLHTGGSESKVNEVLKVQGYHPEDFRKFEEESRMRLEKLRKTKKSMQYELRLCENIQPDLLTKQI